MSKQTRTQRFLVAVIAAIFVMVSYVAAQKVNAAELQFRQALHKQQVEGDLPGAIKLYQEIAASKTAERPVKAKALLQLAVCYETQGKQSEAVYQRIVTEFADQPSAPQARSKLAALRAPSAPPTLTVRKVEIGPGLQNVVATDGKRAIFWDAAGTTLFIGDIVGKERRKVYETNRTPSLTVSRDLSMIFAFMPTYQKLPASYVVIKTDGSGYRDLVLTEDGKTIPPDRPLSMSSTWDNRFLLMSLPQNGMARLLKISVVDGAAQDVLAQHSTTVGAAVSSPDGRFIAYQEGWQAGPGPVRIIPTQGGEPQLIAQEGVVGDWSSDGRYLLVGGMLKGSIGMSAVPIQDGRVSGEPVFIQSSLSLNVLRRTLPDGAMIARSSTTDAPFETSVASLDPQGRLSAWQSIELVTSGSGGAPYPVLSPDGRQIAYVSKAPRPYPNTIRVRNLENGEDRELYRGNNPQGIFLCLWGHRHPNLYCHQSVGGNTEIFSVSLEDGRAQKLGTLNGGRVLHNLSPDDRRVGGNGQETRTGFEWEIGADDDTKRDFGLYSDDGTWLVQLITDSQGRSLTDSQGSPLRIRRTAEPAGDWRVLDYVRTVGPAANGPVPFVITFDSKWVVYLNKGVDGKAGLYRVATSGGDPERLGDAPPFVEPRTYLAVSEDGWRFLAMSRKPVQQPEFWLLDNFIPKAAATKPAAKAGAK